MAKDAAKALEEAARAAEQTDMHLVTSVAFGPEGK